MNRGRGIVLLAALTLLQFVSSAAAPAQTVARQSDGGGSADEETKRRALLAVDGLIDDLGKVSDLNTRIGLSGRIIALLAKEDPSRCRVMLEGLFDAALGSAASEARSRDEDSKSGAQPDPSGSIRLVVTEAAGFDPKLAETFLNKYYAWQADQSQSGSSTTGGGGDLGLAVATSVIDQNPSLALSLGKQSLAANGVTLDSLPFMCALREKSPDLAAQFFDDSLQSISASGAADVNELLLLYVYLFAPAQIPYVEDQRLTRYYVPGVSQPSDYTVDPALARRFLTTSLQLLGDPNRYSPSGLQNLQEGAVGDVAFLRIVESPVQTFAPSLSGVLATELSVASGLLDLDTNARVSDQASALARPDRSVSSSSSSEGSMTQDQLDRRWFRAAMDAVNEQKYDAAFKLVEKMDRAGRDRAREFIAYLASDKMVSGSEVEQGEESSERLSDPIMRASVLVKAAVTLSSSKDFDRVSANEMLSEAVSLANKAGKRSELPAVLLGASAACEPFDSIESSTLLADAVRAANKADNWTVSAPVTRNIDIGGFYFFFTLFDNAHSMSKVVDSLGSRDFDGVLFALRGLNSPIARIEAVTLLCKSILGAQGGSSAEGTGGHRKARPKSAAVK